ncbi:hypothetical protein [Kineococcus auxinigenes]|uniref:hypothetical protein n=1 Tax=unclassified Kineococcus TaxID=2621656 RepID=UPI003D7E3DB5
MTAGPRERGVRLELGAQGWLVLPRERTVDAAGWALAAHRWTGTAGGGDAGDDPSAARASGYLAALVEQARDVLGDGPGVALAHLPDGCRPATAWAFAQVAADPDAVAEADDLAARAQRPGPAAAGTATPVRLPAGAAVRLLTGVAPATGGDPHEGWAELTHVVRPDADERTRVLLRAAWSVLAPTPGTERAVDELARSVAVHVR